METAILILGLFFPALALIIGYLTSSLLANTVPFFWDVVLAIFCPRILFIVYIVMNFETLPHAEGWLIAYILAAIISAFKNKLNDTK